MLDFVSEYGGVAEWMKSKLLCFSSEQSEVANKKPLSAKRPPFERSEIYGGVAEWLKAPVSKTGILERVS